MFRLKRTLLPIAALTLFLWMGLFIDSAFASSTDLDFNPRSSALFPYLGLEDLRLPVSPGTRRCCLLGTNLKMFGLIPGKQTWDPTTLGMHMYGSGPNEYNGNILTCRAGFIDTAHVRYAADLVAKYALSLEGIGPKGGTLRIRSEASVARLRIPPTPYTQDAEWLAETAASIALDITTWHEIATWYDFSAVPFYTEKGSAFSPEDGFSNQLGVALGREALLKSNRTGKNYNEVMTELLQETLSTFGALPECQTTQVLDALEEKENGSAIEAWFDPNYSVPNYRRLKKRRTQLYGELTPSLPPRSLLPTSCELQGAFDQPPPRLNEGRSWNRYQLQFRIRRGTRVSRGLRPMNRVINQTEFPRLIEQAHREIEKEWENPFLN